MGSAPRLLPVTDGDLTLGDDAQVGQALSSRPDLLPPVYLRELGELQDQLPAFPTPIAMDVIRQELGREARLALRCCSCPKLMHSASSSM